MKDETKTYFRNVDLEVRSTEDLTELVRALEPGVMELSCMALDHGYLANLELASQPTEADAAIRSFVGLIEQLPPRARDLWNNASTRDFSIGIEAGPTPSTFDLVLPPDVLKLAADLGARITFVVYVHEPDSPSADLDRVRPESQNKWGIPTQLVEYERAYGQLFPADNPLSPLMLRLMIIRDDLSFELHGIILRQEDGPDRVWQNTYFMRRISSSVSEARNVLRQQEFGKYIKQEWKGTIIDKKVKVVAEEIESLLQLFGELRNDLGGHVRPGETEAGLRAHKNWRGVIVRNMASAYRTSYRQFTIIAPLFVWPDVVDLETFAAKHDRLSKAIHTAVGALLNGIDGLLHAFWTDLPDAHMDVPGAVPTEAAR